MLVPADASDSSSDGSSDGYSDGSSDGSSDDEVDRRKIEFEGLLKSINELDRLAIHVRLSSISSLDARVMAFRARKPAEVYSFEAKAIFAVEMLYPEASETLRRHLSKSMAHRYAKLFYWKSHDKKLRADRRRNCNAKRGEDPLQAQREPTPPLAKGSSHQQPLKDGNRTPQKPEPSRVSVGTSFLSGTFASDPGSRLTAPTMEAKMPVRRQVGASTVLVSGARFPSPPEFEDGEDRKPCPFCRKVFLKVDFTDTVWWR